MLEYTFETHIQQIDGQVWYTALQVPMHIAKPFIDKKCSRIICTINNVHTMHCALMPVGNGTYFINTNKEVRKKLGLEIGSKVQAYIKEDNSKYGMPVPEELQTAWDLDPEGNEVFHTLTVGKQRSLIHLIAKPKSSEIRIKKALTVLEYLKSVNGKLDYKELNEAFKQANQK